MSKQIKAAAVVAKPHLWRWVAESGRLEIGFCQQTGSFIRLLDDGGMIWKGRRRYRDLEEALSEAEAAVARWMKKEYGDTGPG